MLTLGVDAARGGWIAVALRKGRFVDAVLERRFPALLERFPKAEVVGVDVPIGLPQVGSRRRADVDARAVVGARRASVFFTPPRVALEATTYTQARALAPGNRRAGSFSQIALRRKARASADIPAERAQRARAGIQ